MTIPQRAGNSHRPIGPTVPCYCNQFVIQECLAGVEPACPEWKPGTFAARSEARKNIKHSTSNCQNGRWMLDVRRGGSRGTRTGHRPEGDRGRLARTCFRNRLLIQPDDFLVLECSLQLIEWQTESCTPASCGGRNRTCAKAVNSRPPVPTRVPPHYETRGRGEEETRRRLASSSVSPLLPFSLSPSERPAGVEPALPPWQGGRLPLHHGRILNDRIVKELSEHQVRLELTLPHYECGVFAAGRLVHC